MTGILRQVTIIGGGPAGASCALWLKKLGHDPLLVEAGGRLGGLQVDNPFTNGWIVTSPPAPGDSFAKTIQENIEQAKIEHRLSAKVAAVRKHEGYFAISFDDGEEIQSHLVVLATGVRAATGGLTRGPGIVFGPGQQIASADFEGKKVAILGGGDNAFENYLYIRDRGAAEVTVFARSVRARDAFRDAVPQADVRRGDYTADTGELTVNGEKFDILAVFYGFRALMPDKVLPSPGLDHAGYVATNSRCETSIEGLYAIGEIANRMHPCCVTAMADGIVAAKDIQHRLEGRI
ncbi:MAG: NAD(P)/FAD-dependent oxidoreductase [Rhodobiaceae bacterium]|nr:NAD(P)/FAD-dependent oxidoreductase [Rhodobiaceae bacterium]MCC0055345.1 NAD(P)/FAD-dependent oxidoreductase [Rhodobiaceae bacterium]